MTHVKGKWFRRAGLAALAAMTLAFTPWVVTPAQAAPVTGFDAGNIIADSIFYDGAALDAAGVQNFLNQQMPRCTIGDPGRAPGTPIYGTTVAANCLKDFRVTTTSRVANPYCAAYVGAANETAAQIIAKVGRACGISQKVLLVMLEKEQSLVKDTWPTVRQFNVAMGYACPDSGPNNSANCDPTQTGFYQQVYRAAWQLKVYRALPNDYNYRPFQNNTIQWNPSASCGTSQVYIQNWATAALYIYTPYRPNQAALDAGWGTGDACSSYGNRNFYNFFKEWFGDTTGFSVTGDIATYWNATGAGAGIYGHPTQTRQFYSTRFPKGLWLQYFRGGIITTEMSTGKTVGLPFGSIYNHYNSQAGGIYGALGAPVAEPAEYAASGGGTLQWFQGGFIVSSKAAKSTTSMAYGPVYDLYNNVAGGIYGALGYPISMWQGYTGGMLQNFQRGFISQASGTNQPVYMTSGPMFDRYNGQLGGIRGVLGFPVSNASKAANGSDVQEFQKGILANPVSGSVIQVDGAEYASYREAIARKTPLGAPTEAKRSYTVDGGGDLTSFENGLVVTEHTGKRTSYLIGDVYRHYNESLGGIYGAYGYPVSNPSRYEVSGGGTLQSFRNGLVIASGDAQAGMLYDSPVYQRYNGQEGGIYGWLGFPVADEVRSENGERSQEFQFGVIRVDASGRVVALPKASADLYAAVGGASGALGSQDGSPRHYAASGGATLSFFTGGMITETDQEKIAATLNYSSPIYRYYNERAGGIYGSLGYPVSEETTQGGVTTQRFQRGSLRLENGVVVLVAP